MRKIIGTIGATLAIAALVATSAATAKAQSAIEYALMGGFVASGSGGPEIETLGLAARLGADHGLKSGRSAGKPADASGAFSYRRGRSTPFDSVDGLPTAHAGINNRGQIAGSYLADGMTLRGFVRNVRGNYTRFDAAPDAITLPFDINDRGTVVGSYTVAPCGNLACAGAGHGFLRRRDGKVTNVDVPGARTTYAFGINDRGAVVGSYTGNNGLTHGFLLKHDRVTKIDPPAATDDPAASNTEATDINNRGQIVGLYPDPRGTYHGFLYHNRRFTKIDPPRAADVPGIATTAPLGINNRGQVVGQYVNAAGVLHGYLWKRKRGFKRIDPPGGGGTVAADINDRGQILLPAPGTLLKGRIANAGG